MSAELLPCPFCGEPNARVVTRDVEPQGDSWFSPRFETFVLCDCGACLFDELFHEGFGEFAKGPTGEYVRYASPQESATAAWNRRGGA